jgi:MFS family permease
MSKRALVVLIACFFTVFVTYSIRYGYGVLLPGMLTTLAITKTEAGVISASYFVAYSIFSPLLGLMGDRYDSRIVISIFAAVLGVGTLLMTRASSVVEASLYFALAGVGAAACWAPVVALAQRWVSDKRRGLALAVVDVGSAMGIIWMGTVVPLIVIAWDWRAGWLSLGIMALLIAVADFILMRSRPPGEQNPRREELPRASLGAVYSRLLGNGKFWLLGLAYLLTGFAIIIPFTFLSTYAAQELGFPYQVASRLWIVIGVGAIAGKLALGYLSDRRGRIRVIVLCLVLIAAGTLGMVYARSFVVLSLSTAVFSLGYGAVWPLYAASSSDYFSRGLAGSVVGLWTVYLGVGSILAPVIAGWVADATGTLAWSFVVAVAGAVVALALLVPVWKGK